MKTISCKLFLGLIISILLSMPALSSDTHKVGQKNKEFTEKTITIKKGDKVEFVNQDPFFHNVFSLSDVIMFDLGSFPQGDSKTVTFDDVGEVEVECAIHPNMKMKVIVEDK